VAHAARRKEKSMYINWDVTTRFDPNSLVSSAPDISTHGIPIPSYGNYGGANYSAGVEGGTALSPPSPPPVDALDTLFWQHDLVLQNTSATPLDIAQADVTLVEGMYALTQPPTPLDPEGLLYDAFATIGIVAKILTTPTELAYLQAHPLDAAVVITAAEAAIPNFEIGLAETPANEARSLNGAFHVFEARFEQQFEQAIASLGSPTTLESSNVSLHGADANKPFGTVATDTFGTFALHSNVTDGGVGSDTFVFNANFGKEAVLNQDVLAFDHNIFTAAQQAVDHAHDIAAAVQQVLDHANDTAAGVVTPDATHAVTLSVGHPADLHASGFHLV
jgi:hypothetical protein